MFEDRFDPTPSSSRTDLAFKRTLARASDMRGDWNFIRDDAHRANIVCSLQEVHFLILLCNQYNVFWALLQMKYKTALVYTASVAEHVLQEAVTMVENDPRVMKVLGEKWNWLDFSDPTHSRIDVPEGYRLVAGVQLKVQTQIDRNTKMKTLVHAAKAAEIIDDDLADKLDRLRELRNRIHIKTLDEPEYNAYTPQMVNAALDALEAFRVVAMRWIVARRAEELTQTPQVSRIPAVEASVISHSFVAGDDVQHGTLGAGVVTFVEDNGIVHVRFAADASVRKLMVQYAPLHKIATGGATPTV